MKIDEGKVYKWKVMGEGKKVGTPHEGSTWRSPPIGGVSHWASVLSYFDWSLTQEIVRSKNACVFCWVNKRTHPHDLGVGNQYKKSN